MFTSFLRSRRCRLTGGINVCDSIYWYKSTCFTGTTVQILALLLQRLCICTVVQRDSLYWCKSTCFTVFVLLYRVILTLLLQRYVYVCVCVCFIDTTVQILTLLLQRYGRRVPCLHHHQKLHRGIEGAHVRRCTALLVLKYLLYVLDWY